jgi:uncharacterized OsmC-like protein
MKIDVAILEGKKLEANVGGLKVYSDQPVKGGGKNEYPSPYDLFLSSLALCAAHYIRSFCETRNLESSEIKISQIDTHDANDHYKTTVELKVSLPDNFPSQYRDALLASAKGCAVKKTIEKTIDFKLSLEK